MRLISPSGVRVSVSDERGERLLSQGYKREGAAEKAAPSPAPDKPVEAPESEPKRRTRAHKVTAPDNK